MKTTIAMPLPPNTQLPLIRSAAGASGTESDLGNGIILRNHYRCTPPIIQFCSPNYPGGLQIVSDYNGEATVKHLLAYHVDGSHLNHTNPEEIEAIENVIASLLQNGYGRMRRR